MPAPVTTCLLVVAVLTFLVAPAAGLIVAILATLFELALPLVS